MPTSLASLTKRLGTSGSVVPSSIAYLTDFSNRSGVTSMYRSSTFPPGGDLAPTGRIWRILGGSLGVLAASVHAPVVMVRRSNTFPTSSFLPLLKAGVAGSRRPRGRGVAGHLLALLDIAIVAAAAAAVETTGATPVPRATS